MEMTCNCKKDGLPFKYLGLSVSASPDNSFTWDPLLEKIEKRLNN